MKIIVNGREMSFEFDNSNLTVIQLIEHLKLQSTRLVVERNGNVVNRDNYDLEKLSDGDTLEIVRFVGGG